MTRPYTLKVGRHVQYYNAAGKIRPGTVTSVVSATVANLRVGHAGETPAVVPRGSQAGSGAAKVSVWTP